MQCEIVLLGDVEDWFLALVESGDSDAAAVTAAIDYLEAEGPTLGRPAVDKVKGSRFHNMKELRPHGTSIRILFVFDPRRRAILLVAGDKAGEWEQWYIENIPIAEERYEIWLEESTE